MNPSATQPPTANDTPFKTDVVQDIPMSTQAPSQPVVEKDDVELDLMMQDVGQELKKNVKRPVKHHFFSKKSKEPEILQPKPGAQAVPQSVPMPSQPAVPVPTSGPQAQTSAQTAAKALPKPKAKHSVPIFIILVTIIVTGALVVVAVAAYKQK